MSLEQSLKKLENELPKNYESLFAKYELKKHEIKDIETQINELSLKYEKGEFYLSSIKLAANLSGIF